MLRDRLLRAAAGSPPWRPPIDMRQSSPTHAPKLVVHDSEPGGFLFASYHNVVVAIWTGSATLSAVERLTKAAAPVRASTGRGSSVHLIFDSAGLPTEEARAGFVKLSEKSAESIACLGIVVAGTGFWASALRSAMTGIHQQRTGSFDYRLLGSIDELVEWLPAAHDRGTGVALEPKSLRAAIEAAVSQAR
jgi:hypothetical protein